jgi:hypothetical protein
VRHRFPALSFTVLVCLALLSAAGVLFTESVLLEMRPGGHDIRAGDVDGDGDIDIVSKIWSVWSGNSNGGNVHIDYLENLRKSR